MSSSPDPLAIYAAIVSTVVFVWDIVKWRRQERLYLVGSATGDMAPSGSAIAVQTMGKTLISLRVDNRGHIPCEISNMLILVYDNWWKAVRGKAFKTIIIPDPLTSLTQMPLPYRLEPGGTYLGLCVQQPEHEEWSRKKRLYVGVLHNMSTRPFKVRLNAIGSAKEKHAEGV